MSLRDDMFIEELDISGLTKLGDDNQCELRRDVNF
jgi:hypothetical protein